MDKTILIVAGEMSGDQHAAKVMAEVLRQEPHTNFWGLGGEQMLVVGMEQLYSVDRLSVTGFVEVLKHLSFFKEVMNRVVTRCERDKPDAAILLDYPGFNMRLGKKLHDMGIPVYYYISPQVWAWRSGRINTIRRFVRKMFVIFPFEEEIYTRRGVPAEFVGHPLVEEMPALQDRAAFFNDFDLDPDRPLVGILPGSRTNEVSRLLKPCLNAVTIIQDLMPQAQFAVARVGHLSDTIYNEIAQKPGVRLIPAHPYEIMAYSHAAMVASGTASLESAMLGTPMVVIYKISPLSYLLARMLVEVEHIAMPNLVYGDRVVPELLQSHANGANIASWILTYLGDKSYTSQVKSKLHTIREKLGLPGGARRVAEGILTDLNAGKS
ncbi:MAG: lipid-A-disaccharide synthase [Candidatus Marinimicrobia bacterium]|nr:lipid-A-disaccharide synthase [Candidatus Neomarinimicrobiota bacterium]MCF7902526.1 lipid-A-disaccharide synthase [Candidatus Neomarinimicrobiota bacterium]